MTGQTLRLVHVDDADHQNLDAYPESVREAAAAFHERLDERRARHEDALKHLGDALGVESERVILTGRPWETLVEHAAESRASLLVVGPHASGLGSTSRRVATHAPCPVIVAGEGAPPDFRKLPWVVGLAHHHHVAGLLRDIGALAARTASPLVPTRVLPRLASGGTEAQALLAEVDAAARDELERLSADLGVSVTPHVTSGGHPATVLLEEARGRGAGLAVAAHAGDRPRDALRRFFLGSVTEKIVREAAGVPIFVSPASGPAE